MTAPERLAETLQRAQDEQAQVFFTQGEVTAFSASTVTVDITGDVQTWPKLASYTPTVGDIVWLGGPPGTWVCLGTVADIQNANLGHLTVTDIALANGGNAIRADASRDGAIRWGTDGALEVVTRDGAGPRGVRLSTLIATDLIDGPRHTAGASSFEGNGFSGPQGSFGGVIINGGGIDLTGKSMGGVNNIDVATLSCGFSHINSGGFSGSAGAFGGVLINGGGIDLTGKSVGGVNNIDVATLSCGASHINTGGFSGSSASFGGVLINGGGVDTYGRNVVAYDAILNMGYGWVYAGTYFTNTSERRLKRDIRRVPDTGHLDVIRGAPLYDYRYDPAQLPEGVDPEITEQPRRGVMVDDLPDDHSGETPDGLGRAPALNKMLDTTWGAIRELTGIVDDLRGQVDALTARVAALEKPGRR